MREVEASWLFARQKWKVPQSSNKNKTLLLTQSPTAFSHSMENWKTVFHIPSSSLRVQRVPKRNHWRWKSRRRLWWLWCVVQVKDRVEDSWDSAEAWRMELYISVGIMALGLLSLLAVTSLPSVANTVNWREFSFIQVRTHTHTHTHTTESVMCWRTSFYPSWTKDRRDERRAMIEVAMTVDT